MSDLSNDAEVYSGEDYVQFQFVEFRHTSIAC